MKKGREGTGERERAQESREGTGEQRGHRRVREGTGEREHDIIISAVCI